jgi:hypothetical protein
MRSVKDLEAIRERIAREIKQRSRILEVMTKSCRKLR